MVLCVKWVVLHTAGIRTVAWCAKWVVLHTASIRSVAWCVKRVVFHAAGVWRVVWCVKRVVLHTADGRVGLWEEFFYDLWVEVEDAADLAIACVVLFLHLDGDVDLLVGSEDGGTSLIEGLPA